MPSKALAQNRLHDLRNEAQLEPNQSDLLVINSRSVLIAFMGSIFAVYFATMYPSLSGGDSGELLTTICTKGVAHPPGYPLWTWLGIFWNACLESLAQEKSVAWRVNLMSIVLAVGASYFLSRATEMATLGYFRSQHQAHLVEVNMDQDQVQKKPLKRRKQSVEKEVIEHSEVVLPGEASKVAFWCSLLASGMYSFYPSIWEYSIQAEVFSLNNFLCCLLLERFVSYALDDDPKPWKAYVISLVSGLCLTNQHTSVLFVAPMAICVMWFGGWKLFRPRHLAVLSLAALIGLSPYIHLPIASNLKRVDSWGDQRTLDGFLTHFLRKEYGTFQLASEMGEDQSFNSIMRRNFILFTQFSEGSFFAGIPLLLGSLLVLCRALPKVGGPMAFCYALYIGLLNSLANLSFSPVHLAVQGRMWLQVHSIGFFGFGVGSAVLLFKTFPSNIRIRVAPVMCLTLVVLQCAKYYKDIDSSSINIFNDYAKDLLSPLPDDAILLVHDDLNCNVIQYYMRCEGMKHPKPGQVGIQLLRLPLITWPWFNSMQKEHFPGVIFPGTKHHPHEIHEGTYNMGMFLDANMKGKHPVYIAGPFKEGDPSYSNYHRIPIGLADKLIPVNMGMDMDFYQKQLVKSFKVQRDHTHITRKGSWEVVARIKYLEFYARATQYIAEMITPQLTDADAVEKKFNILKLARKIFQRLYKLSTPYDPKSDFFVTPLIWKNAGVVCGQMTRSPKRSEKMVEDMFRFWMIYVDAQTILQKTTPSQQSSEEELNNVKILLRDQVNPFTQEHHAFDWINSESYII